MRPFATALLLALSFGCTDEDPPPFQGGGGPSGTTSEPPSAPQFEGDKEAFDAGSAGGSCIAFKAGEGNALTTTGGDTITGAFDPDRVFASVPPSCAVIYAALAQGTCTPFEGPQLLITIDREAIGDTIVAPGSNFTSTTQPVGLDAQFIPALESDEAPYKLDCSNSFAEINFKTLDEETGELDMNFELNLAQCEDAAPSVNFTGSIKMTLPENDCEKD